MARDLRYLPRRELAVDVLGERLAALGEALDFLGDVGGRVVLREAQLLDAVLKLRDGLLELEEGGLHRVGADSTPSARRRLRRGCGRRPCRRRGPGRRA